MFSGAEYYLTSRGEKGGFDTGEFARTVGGDTLTGSINPFAGVGKAGKIVKVAKGNSGTAGDVARNFPRPPVRDLTSNESKKLDGAYEQLFRPQDRIPGGTAEAIRREGPSGPHIQKGKERASQLKKLIDSGKLSEADALTAQQVRNDLIDALKSQGR